MANEEYISGYRGLVDQLFQIGEQLLHTRRIWVRFRKGEIMMVCELVGETREEVCSQVLFLTRKLLISLFVKSTITQLKEDFFEIMRTRGGFLGTIALKTDFSV